MPLEKASVCTLDCPDTCSLTVTVENDRVVKIRGSHANPLTQGTICKKVTFYYPEYIHGPDRIMTPLRRTGAKGSGQFEPISWDAALDIVHERFSEVIENYGGEAVLPFNYAGPHGLLGRDSMSLRFFHKIGATLVDRPPLCGGIQGNAYGATFGDMTSMPVEHLDHAQLIIVWGNNVTGSNLHLTRHINAAQKRGAKLVVIDPKRTRIAEQADLFIPVNPGSDVMLAWAIAQELERNEGLDHDFIAQYVHGFDEYMQHARQYSISHIAGVCGIEESTIRQLADWYQQLSPAAIAMGNGPERNINGGSAIRAACALPALAGKFGVAGGGVLLSGSSKFPLRKDRLLRPDLAPAGTRTMNILDASRWILDESLDPPLKALFIYNHNPVIVHPDQNRMKQALAKEDVFIVGSDAVMTDSMAYADVVLPMCTSFEHDDLFPAYGHHYLQRAEAVIPPVGESLPLAEIFRRLAAKFGFEDPLFQESDAELMDAVANDEDPRMKGIQPSQIPVGEAVPMYTDNTAPIAFVDVFPGTPSGKVELVSENLGRKFDQALPSFRKVASKYPLTLITPASDKRITSTFGNVEACNYTPVLEMHPSDASTRGLNDGDQVKVWNELGEVHLPLKVTEDIRPGVVCSEKGSWFKTSDNGQTVSALAPLTKADLGGACFNDARVEVALTE